MSSSSVSARSLPFGVSLYSLPVLLSVGFLLRVLLAPWFAGFGYDMDVVRNWVWHLVNEPLDQFYALADAPDHLPGDLWFFLALGHAFTWLGGENIYGDVFLPLIKLIPTLADLAVGLLLFAIVRDVGSDLAGRRAALWYLLNPATIFLTAVWGQWDSLSFALFLLGVLLLLRTHRWWLAPMPFFAWAVLIKPPLLVLVACMLLVPLSAVWRAGASRISRFAQMLGNLLAAGAVSVLTVTLLSLPFDVGLFGVLTRWSLVERAQIALNFYEYRVLSAFNLWMAPQGTLERYEDTVAGPLVISFYLWGLIMVTVALVGIAYSVWKLWNRVSVVTLAVWAGTAAGMALFLFPTRVHERYLFPAMVLAILLVALHEFRPPWRGIALWMSGLYFVNLLLVYTRFELMLPESIAWIAERPLFTTGSLLMLAVFAALMIAPWRSWPDGSQHADRRVGYNET